MKVKIKRWHGVATWKWEIDEDVCGICRYNIIIN
jgi:anaphase-promoting complex subunit 11